MFGEIKVEFSEDIRVKSKVALASGIEVQIVNTDYEDKDVSITSLIVNSCGLKICDFEITFDDVLRVSSYEIDKLRFRFKDSFVVESA